MRRRVALQALILGFGQYRGVEAHVALTLDECVELTRARQAHGFAMLEGEIGSILLLGDGNYGFAGEIATEDKHVRAIELGAVHEFLEADIRAVKIRGEEELYLSIRRLVLLSPKHQRPSALRISSSTGRLPTAISSCGTTTTRPS